MSTTVHRCLFCDHSFGGRSRKFCYDCLPALADLPQPAYGKRYNDLNRAVGGLDGAYPKSRIPKSHPAFTVEPPKPKRPRKSYCRRCEICDAEFTTRSKLARVCSNRCRSRRGKRVELQKRRAAREESPHTCPTCSAEFVPMMSTHRYCSDDCRPGPTYRGVFDAGACRHCGDPAEPREGFARAYTCEPCRRENSRRIGRRYRLRRNNPEIEHDGYTVAYLIERDGMDCSLCGGEMQRVKRFPQDPDGVSVDHIVPLSKGGHNTANNVKLAHFGCNAKKRDRVWGDGEQLLLIG